MLSRSHCRVKCTVCRRILFVPSATDPVPRHEGKRAKQQNMPGVDIPCPGSGKPGVSAEAVS